MSRSKKRWISSPSCPATSTRKSDGRILSGTPAAIQTLTASGTAQSPAVTAVLSFSYSDPAGLADEIKQLYPNVKATVGKAVSGSAGGGVLVVTGHRKRCGRGPADRQRFGKRDLPQCRHVRDRAVPDQVRSRRRFAVALEPFGPQPDYDPCPGHGRHSARADHGGLRRRDRDHHVLRRSGGARAARQPP